MRHNELRELIRALLDPNVEFGDRDDIAMALGSHDDPEVEAALMAIATDQEEDEDLADSCGESLAEIWGRRETFDASWFDELVPEAFIVAKTMLSGMHPEWRDELERLSGAGAEE